MTQPGKLVIACFAFLATVTLLHAHVNLGMFERADIVSVDGETSVRKSLRVGHLPVTCHLTCPVTSWVSKHSEQHSEFVSWRYTSWPAMTEDIDAGNLDAAFILAPLAMVMQRQGTPVKIVHLGHRDGTAIVVREDSPYQSFEDLRGKRIAIPHRYSNQRILVEKLKDEYRFTNADITMIDYPPPEMPAGLKSGQFEAYIVGEPFAAKAEMDGFGRVLYFTKDIWPDFISCVLVVTERLIERDPELVAELVQGISASGKWIDEGDGRLMAGLREEDSDQVGEVTIPKDFGSSPRMQAAMIAARQEYYNQDPELLKFVLTRPIDRVRYTQLNLAKDDFKEIQQYAEQLGFFSFRPVTADDPFGFEDYCDPSFEQSGMWTLPVGQEGQD
ncbi:NitT/TauT family transport system substrate-binding protein [Neorhodopirellula lusitana]|uniref:NitT/TauT family transport system substrate-binding protein n=1 Tax=Neorhodopirellula lusitana TaxID=445327 RepID=A0ABY1QA61_9BACT|nr:ABC transporter substrate-binding protein [Neorhodopirellula lusitana]SMP65234.1 NitT/TauT family transport system substrate-binding protein [Neorhodopirellula lusitana]